MIIDFENRVTLKKVEEMIASAVSFTTGIINLSTSTPEQIKDALETPDRWLFSYNYSGETYLEQFRRETNSGESYDITFYVIGAPWTTIRGKIYDKKLVVGIDVSTGVIKSVTEGYRPDVVYYLERMGTDQIKFLSGRLGKTGWYTHPENARFTVIWPYNNKIFVYSAGLLENNAVKLCGTAIAYENNSIKVYYDILTINGTTGDITHNEYSSNTVLTPVE